MPPARGADDVDRTSLLRDLGDLVLERLERAGDIRLEDDVELLDLALADLGEDFVEAHLAGLAPRELLGLEALVALVRELAGKTFAIDRLEAVASFRDPVEAEHFDRVAGLRLSHLRPGVVVHRADLAPHRARDERVADVQGPALDQQR